LSPGGYVVVRPDDDDAAVGGEGDGEDHALVAFERRQSGACEVGESESPPVSWGSFLRQFLARVGSIGVLGGFLQRRISGRRPTRPADILQHLLLGLADGAQMGDART
jgi:hypothetical protein